MQGSPNSVRNAAEKPYARKREVATDRELEGEAAIVWALLGNAAQAQKLANDLSKHFPEATIVRFGYVPAARGLLAIQQGKTQEGVEYLRIISSHERVMSPGGSTVRFVSAYVSGEAYLRAHRGTEAAARFQILIRPLNMFVALARLGLGRAYVLMGDKVKAKAAYEDFLTQWKDADPDIPVLQQAKAEYAKLK